MSERSKMIYIGGFLALMSWLVQDPILDEHLVKAFDESDRCSAHHPLYPELVLDSDRI